MTTIWQRTFTMCVKVICKVTLCCGSIRILPVALIYANKLTLYSDITWASWRLKSHATLVDILIRIRRTHLYKNISISYIDKGIVKCIIVWSIKAQCFQRKLSLIHTFLPRIWSALLFLLYAKVSCEIVILYYCQTFQNICTKCPRQLALYMYMP